MWTSRALLLTPTIRQRTSTGTSPRASKTHRLSQTVSRNVKRAKRWGKEKQISSVAIVLALRVIQPAQGAGERWRGEGEGERGGKKHGGLFERSRSGVHLDLTPGQVCPTVRREGEPLVYSNRKNQPLRSELKIGSAVSHTTVITKQQQRLLPNSQLILPL
ncbi:hypothetical protein ElyMa_000975300 [Elysia marginata]|uniref:Uncharacterized protein n=1 Tax=Elysia marginata TaxID=1093978 RepID=A0AAV4HIT4_9GAST|nr:hypothetical protein ElyMa_000975300 [Elysia marginata]